MKTKDYLGLYINTVAAKAFNIEFDKDLYDHPSYKVTLEYQREDDYSFGYGYYYFDVFVDDNNKVIGIERNFDDMAFTNYQVKTFPAKAEHEATSIMEAITSSDPCGFPETEQKKESAPKTAGSKVVVVPYEEDETFAIRTLTELIEGCDPSSISTGDIIYSLEILAENADSVEQSFIERIIEYDRSLTDEQLILWAFVTEGLIGILSEYKDHSFAKDFIKEAYEKVLQTPLHTIVEIVHAKDRFEYIEKTVERKLSDCL